MVFGFRRSKKLFPGVRLNLTKKGVSVRVGKKGIGFTSGTSGQRASVGLPGTGLYYTKKLGSGSQQSRSTLIGVFIVVGLIVFFAFLFFL